jgi:hypothetical protein
MSALPGWKFRLAVLEDAEAFTQWTLANPQIDPKDIEAAKKENNPTVLFFAVENADGKVIAFAPVYTQAIVAHLVFNPEADGKECLSAMQMLLNGTVAFEVGMGVREIVTLSKPEYGVAKWAMKHGFDLEPRQVFKFDINKVLAVAKEESTCAVPAEK